ncbi:MAG: four helix bundle protein [Prosthecochloris sp.]|nr:four helix bundle protein [Prosthecochloris sp.]
MNNHRDLEVWQKSIDFAVNIYRLTEKFPSSELYGLVSQMRRSAVSISSNIAEGAARNGNKEFIQFLHVALGSASEIETQLIIAERLQYIQKDELVVHELGGIQKMLMGLIKYLRAQN